MSELTGIFARGKLLGYQKITDRYKDANQVQQEKEVHLLGIEREVRDSFGQARASTLALVIPTEKLKDNEFMSSFRNLTGQIVEIGLSGYTDYSKSRRPFISNDAKIISLTTGIDASVTSISPPEKKVAGLGI